jgi:predicted cation transporter
MIYYDINPTKGLISVIVMLGLIIFCFANNKSRADLSSLKENSGIEKFAFFNFFLYLCQVLETPLRSKVKLSTASPSKT